MAIGNEASNLLDKTEVCFRGPTALTQEPLRVLVKSTENCMSVATRDHIFYPRNLLLRRGANLFEDRNLANSDVSAPF